MSKLSRSAIIDSCNVRACVRACVRASERIRYMIKAGKLMNGLALTQTRITV
jgi:hypothetical protein